MKFEVSRTALLKACQLVAPAVAARSTKPALGCIKITADAAGCRLVLAATDNEIGIRHTITAVEVSRGGSALVLPSKIIPILRESEGDTVRVDGDENGTTIRTGGGRFKLPGGNPDELPDVPDIDSEANMVGVQSTALKLAIGRVAPAADKTEATARWAVTGILLERIDKAIRLAATDTRRMAYQDVSASDCGDNATWPANTLVPTKTMAMLARDLDDCAGESVGISVEKNEVAFATAFTLIRSKLVEGRFPPYRDIVPKKPKVTLEVPVSEFLSRVRQAAIMTDDETKRVDLKFEAGKLTLESQGGADNGSGQVAMDLPDYKGDGVEIAFNPQYLIDMLRTVDGEPAMKLEMTNGDRPAVFRLGDEYLHLVMPLTG